MRKGVKKKKKRLNSDIIFTSDPAELDKASFYIVAVPTPIDDHRTPDLAPLLSATRTVAPHLKKGDYVVYESTCARHCINVKRLVVALIVSISLTFASNLAWLIATTVSAQGEETQQTQLASDEDR